jgi:hypothetical protein
MIGDKVPCHFTEMDKAEECSDMKRGLSSSPEAPCFGIGRQVAKMLDKCSPVCASSRVFSIVISLQLFQLCPEKFNISGVDKGDIVNKMKFHVWLPTTR